MDWWLLAGVPVTSFIVALSGALMPGPLLTLTVGEAARRGFWAGPLIIVGHALLELALVLLILAGVGVWLHRPLVLGLVGVLGAGLLWWMGLGLLKASRHGHLEIRPQGCIGPQPHRGRGAHERRQPLLAHLVAHHRPGLRHVFHAIRLAGGGPLLRRSHPGRLRLVHPGVRGCGPRTPLDLRPHLPGLSGRLRRLSLWLRQATLRSRE